MCLFEICRFFRLRCDSGNKQHHFKIFDNVNMFYDVTYLLLNVRFYFAFIAWAERKGYKTAKAARNDVYRAANSLLRLAVDGRLCLCLRPSGYGCLRGNGGIFPDLS